MNLYWKQKWCIKKGHKKPRVEKEGEILGFEHQSKGCLGK